MDGRQHRKKVAKSHKPMRTLTKPPAASETMLLSKPRDETALASELGAPSFCSPLAAIAVRHRAAAAAASDVLGHQVIAAAIA